MDIPTYLEAKNMSQADFCRLTDIKPATLSNYILGKRTPSSRHAMTMVYKTNNWITLKDLMDYADKHMKK